MELYRYCLVSESRSIEPSVTSCFKQTADNYLKDQDIFPWGKAKCDQFLLTNSRKTPEGLRHCNTSSVQSKE
ncbi:hypothetical protein chiPu_0020637 [Chiloscyllium punctatum]|uniref:Uncharacterized protein n=1 Tax=Chiloscyllium punctatum TaxID=137246 RepID=A0A401RHS6_CHIPU|nr:hypothetical protein [Chiloscyllium punctatum]